MEHQHKIDSEMASLNAAAEAGDESAFLAALRNVDWQSRSVEDYITATRLALQAGAHLAARRLSAEGAEHYPDHEEIQKYASVLAPPKVTRSSSQPIIGMEANREWIKTDGENYRGQWVALREGQFLGSATTLKKLAKKIGDVKGIFITKVF